MCDNIYACKWKLDGSGVKGYLDAMIEIIDLEETEKIKKLIHLILKSYKTSFTRLQFSKKMKKIFQAFIVQNTLKSNRLDKRQHPPYIKKSPNHFGDNKLTVQSGVYHNNNSSVMSVLTIDNPLTSHTDTKVKEVK